MKKQILEIEARCRVADPEKFRVRLRELKTFPSFPDERGEVLETNTNFSKRKMPSITFRVRARRFQDGRVDFSYTQKGKNQSSVLRVKKEKNKTLHSNESLKNRVLKLQSSGAIRDFEYERSFEAEDYRVYKAKNGIVEIELFEFPFLGWFAEFELSRGSQKFLERVMEKFGFRFSDNIQEGTKDMWKAYCQKYKLPETRTLLFKEAGARIIG